MAYLVDTNILVRLATPADPHYLSARRAVEALEDDGLYAASQNFVELWNVITRPVQNNGLGQATGVAPGSGGFRTGVFTSARTCREL